MTRRPRSIAMICLGLLILSTGCTLSPRDQTSLPTFQATIQDDCAPWDGSAFTVSIPIEESRIEISIYQSPDIQHQTTFSFPDDSGQLGNAILVDKNGLPELLRGEVIFQGVEAEREVQGQFDLLTDRGDHFEGKFVAQWEHEIIYCG